MEETIDQAVWRAVDVMRDNLGENLTLDDIARAAMYSKYHFARAFHRRTGVPPARFLSALRLAEAKRLLVSTRVTVTGISHQVGYSSFGTFSSRFTSVVGMSPNAYRQCGGYVSRIRLDPHGAETRSAAVVRGRIHAGRHLGPVCAGLFPSPIPQASPVRCAVLPGPGRYVFTAVPLGVWYLLAQSTAPGAERRLGHPDSGDPPPWVASCGPIVIGPGDRDRTADALLRPMRTIDPPVLLALLNVRSAALTAS
jgi:AraC family transcriptional regulator